MGTPQPDLPHFTKFEIFDENGVPTSEGFDYLTNRFACRTEGLTKPVEPSESTCFEAWGEAGADPALADSIRERSLG